MRRKIKWIFTLIAILLFLFVGDKLPGEPLSSRAMVVGFGIDLEGDSSVKISAQILNAASASETSGQTTQVVTATSSTISGAMSRIGEKSGSTVALTHCNVVFLCQKLAKSRQFYSILNYLITNDYLSENAYLFAVDGKAEDFMTSATAFGGNLSLYIQKAVGMHGEYVDLPIKTLRDVLVSYHSLGQTNWIPVLKKEPLTPEQSESGQSPSDEQSVFTANSLYVLKKNVFLAEYGEAGARALNLAKNEVKKGVVESVGDHGEKIVCLITGKKAKFSYDLEKKTVDLALSINAIVKEIVDYSSDDAYVDRTQMTDEEVKRAQSQIADEVEAFFVDLRQKDADIFGVLDGFYSKYGKQTAALTIGDINLKVNVDLKVSKV
ncbi:MAG: hypothetical protein IJ735_04865 [Clostridia bacterium]|nr:hypothetical protein [Clostridia bacterium]